MSRRPELAENHQFCGITAETIRQNVEEIASGLKDHIKRLKAHWIIVKKQNRFHGFCTTALSALENRTIEGHIGRHGSLALLVH